MKKKDYYGGWSVYYGKDIRWNHCFYGYEDEVSDEICQKELKRVLDICKEEYNWSDEEYQKQWDSNIEKNINVIQKAKDWKEHGIQQIIKPIIKQL